MEKEEKLTLIKRGFQIGKLIPDLVGSIQFNYFKGGLTSIKIASTINPKEVIVVGAKGGQNDNGK